MTDLAYLTAVKHDVVIVGCGISGLIAGLQLQRAGRRVRILDRRGAPGGLCGTHTLDGYEFVIACNDFGAGFERQLRRLGVPARFHHWRTRLHVGGSVREMPMGVGGALRLLRHAPDALRLLRAARRDGTSCLGALVAREVRDPSFADTVHSLCYPLGISPHAVPIEALRAELSREYGYRYDRPRAPEGGPGALIRTLTERFEQLGGEIQLATECLAVRSEGHCKSVETSAGSMAARCVIETGNAVAPPRSARPGLAVSQLLLAVGRNLAFPSGVHTLVHLPSDIADWLGRLDAGEEPEAFGFHFFRSDLPNRPDHYTLNAYLFLPRHMDAPPYAVVERVERYVLEHMEELCPGLANELLYKRFVSPVEFEALHGLSSRLPARPPPGVSKPPVHDRERDVFRAGNAVGPPGDHAGAAALSAMHAALAVERLLAAPA